MSTDINSVILVGRLTRDASVDYLPSGSPVASISIAVNRGKKEGEQWVNEVNFFDVSLFGKSAENLKQYLLKGKQVAIQGSLKQDRWEKDGQKFSKIRIMANNIELLGGRSEGGQNGGGSYGNSYGNGGASYGSSTGGFQPRNNFASSQQGDSYGSMDSGESFGDDGSGFSEDIPF